MMETENENGKYFDVSPISKSRRLLVFLADLFITFLFGLTLFSVAVFPISKAISGYDTISENIVSDQKGMIDILYDNSLLNQDPEKEKYSLNDNLTYCGKLYAISLLKEDHEHDYLYHYYVDLKGEKESKLVDVLSHYSYNFFDFSNGVHFQTKYVEEFHALLDEADTMSEQGEKDYKSFISKFFSEAYSDLLDDLLNSTFSLASLNQFAVYSQKITLAEESQRATLIVASVIAYVLSVLIYSLLIPMLNRRGKTISMYALRIERVGRDNFFILKRPERPFMAVYSLVFHLPSIVFLPLLFITFTNLFANLPLMILAGVGLVFDLVSMCFILFTQFGMSLSDLLSKSFLMDKERYEELSLLKGKTTCQK